MENTKKQIGNVVKYGNNKYEALEGAISLIIATEWGEFRTFDITEIKEKYKIECVFDGRNVCDANLMKINGFQYFSIGRSSEDL